MPLINKLVVFGVGLIGGSFALALKQAGQVAQVVGVGRSPDNLQTAQDLGIIDSYTQDVAQAVHDADMVLLAMPVGQMPRVMQSIAPHLPPHCVVTDAGSTKGDVATYMQQYLAPHLPYCVPAHPIAGAEQSGAAAANPDLYQQKNIVITPLPSTLPYAQQQVADAWLACGGIVQTMTPQAHDRIFAAVSHLPHVLAFALVDEIAGRDNADTLFGFAASGFKDFTRIASSHPEMWRDICLANQAAILAELQAYQASLKRMEHALQAQDAKTLEQIFTQARDARNAWLTRLN